MRYRNPLKRLINASKYSLEGLYYALKNEQAFQYEFSVFVILILILSLTSLSFERKIFLLVLWLMVMAFELVNSAVEKSFDLIDKNFRAEIKSGKDMLSAAVFIMVGFNIFLWLTLIIEALIKN